MPKPRCDIFCRVIDNFGDVGVCWRLARQLSNETGFDVCLWLDDLNALQKIWPSAQLVKTQHLAGVCVKQWLPDSQFVGPADLLIEAFACDIPEQYIAHMGGGHVPKLWINLEYLSAEDWVGDCHGLPSIHPRLGYRKIFFFPGFDSRSGGLLREEWLPAKRNTLVEESFLKQWFEPSDSLLASLFAYKVPYEWLQSWINSSKPLTLLLPENLALQSLQELIGQELKVGDCWQKGELTIQVLPFLSQSEYDQLLWACDINFVRGEDSLVRAIWAEKPFIWQAYPQDGNAHWDKVDALLARFDVEGNELLQNTLQEAFWGWNNRTHSSPWEALIESRIPWQTLAKKWSRRLALSPDLCAQIWTLYNAQN